MRKEACPLYRYKGEENSRKEAIAIVTELKLELIIHLPILFFFLLCICLLLSLPQLLPLTFGIKFLRSSALTGRSIPSSPSVARTPTILVGLTPIRVCDLQLELGIP